MKPRSMQQSIASYRSYWNAVPSTLSSVVGTGSLVDAFVVAHPPAVRCNPPIASSSCLELQLALRSSERQRDILRAHTRQPLFPPYLYLMAAARPVWARSMSPAGTQVHTISSRRLDFEYGEGKRHGLAFSTDKLTQHGQTPATSMQC